MAGKIIADQIEHSTAGSLDTSYVVNGSAKAWGATVTDSAVAGDSFNVSSIFDLGSGDNRPSWSSVFTNADYSILASNVHSTSEARVVGIGAVTTSQADMQTFVTSNAGISTVSQNFTCTGDLA